MRQALYQARDSPFTRPPRTAGGGILIPLLMKRKLRFIKPDSLALGHGCLRYQADSVFYLFASRINACLHHVSTCTRAYQEGRLHPTGPNIPTQMGLF